MDRSTLSPRLLAPCEERRPHDDSLPHGLERRTGAVGVARAQPSDRAPERALALERRASMVPVLLPPSLDPLDLRQARQQAHEPSTEPPAARRVGLDGLCARHPRAPLHDARRAGVARQPQGPPSRAASHLRHPPAHEQLRGARDRPLAQGLRAPRSPRARAGAHRAHQALWRRPRHRLLHHVVLCATRGAIHERRGHALRHRSPHRLLQGQRLLHDRRLSAS